MADIGLGAGLATLAFWGFLSTAVVAGIWDGIRKREAKHETVRRLLESGQNIDADLMEKLVSLTDGKSERPDRIFFLTGLWILPVSVGLVVFGYIMGGYYPQTYAPLMGASALLAILGIGFLVASKIVGRWYVDSDSSMDI